MPPKKMKGNMYLQRFKDAEEQHRVEQERKVRDERAKEKEENKEEVSAQKLFDDLIRAASPGDILTEYLWFKRNLIPKLLDSIGTHLLMQVRTHLNIDEAKEKLCESTSGESVKLEGDRFPILDSLSCLLGVCLRNILAPPVQKCVLCQGSLTLLNKPVSVPLHTLAGPQMATKYMYQCKSCPGTFKFRNQYEDKNRIYYHIGN